MERNDETPDNPVPAYYAIIPARVRYHEGISLGAKLLFGEITALTNKTGFCWASNRYFARLYGVDNRTITRWLADLSAAGVITAEISKAEGNARRIWLWKKTSGAIDKNVPTPIDKNVLQNTTRGNTTEKTPISPARRSAAKDMALLAPLWIQRLGNLFNRRASTAWSAKEKKAFDAICPIDENDLSMVERYYAAERKKGDKGIHRRDLKTLLNNWPGEVDRARAYCKRFEFRKGRPAPQRPEPKPGDLATDADFQRAGALAKAELEKLRARLRGPAVDNGEPPLDKTPDAA
jgi:hypothetical protein